MGATSWTKSYDTSGHSTMPAGTLRLSLRYVAPRTFNKCKNTKCLNSVFSTGKKEIPHYSGVKAQSGWHVLVIVTFVQGASVNWFLRMLSRLQAMSRTQLQAVLFRKSDKWVAAMQAGTDQCEIINLWAFLCRAWVWFINSCLFEVQARIRLGVT